MWNNCFVCVCVCVCVRVCVRLFKGDSYTWKHLHVFLCVWQRVERVVHESVCWWVCLLKHNDCSVSYLCSWKVVLWDRMWLCTCEEPAVHGCMSVCTCVCVCVRVCVRGFGLSCHYGLTALGYNSILSCVVFLMVCVNSRWLLKVHEAGSSIMETALQDIFLTIIFCPVSLLLYNLLTCNTQPSFFHLAD